MDIFAVSDDGKMWSAWWDGNWHDWFPIFNATFEPGAPVTAITRNPNQMDIFAVRGDGKVWSAWWDGNWHDWFPVRP